MKQVKIWTQDGSDKVLAMLNEKMGWKLEPVIAKADEVFDPQNRGEILNHKCVLNQSRELLIHFPAQSEKVQLLDVMDCLVEKQGKAWPELLLVPAIKKAVRRRIKTLNIGLAAYISANDLHLRALVASAAELGFSKICLVAPDKDWLIQEKKYLSRRLIGLQVEAVATQDLTLRPQDASLFLNAFNLHQHKDFLHDLAYYNFMGSGGVVVDLYNGGPHQTLQEEAGKAHLECVKPQEVFLSYWLEMARLMGLTAQITKEKEEELFASLV